MKKLLTQLNENIAANTVASMTNEDVLSSTRLTTGDQYFVYAVKTVYSEYVIRMTTIDHKKKFESAIYWQSMLLPLGIPLAKFIQTDLDGIHSQYPSLLMRRIPGDDLCNIYSDLTTSDKKNLANEIVQIHAAMNNLPDGNGYGIVDSYKTPFEEKSWYNFLINRLELFKPIIKQKNIFNIRDTDAAISIAKDIESEFQTIRSRPFLWDATERNVLVHNGKISGIVDVDELCFGDPLFALALTYIGLEIEGHDTIYPDSWAEALELDIKAELRLEFYRLFLLYCVHAKACRDNSQ